MEEAAKQQPPSNAPAEDGPSSTSNRQVGMKSKREEDEEDDGTEWEEAPVGGTFDFSLFKLNVIKLKFGSLKF